MEKYIFALILIVIVAFAFCAYPALFSKEQNAYVVTKNSFAAECILDEYQKWSTDEFFVYKLSGKNAFSAKLVPNSTSVCEYYFSDENILKMDSPLMQVYSSGDKVICGIPYIID